MGVTNSVPLEILVMAGLQGNYFDILQHKDKLPGVPPLWLPFRRKPCFLNVSHVLVLFSQVVCTYNSQNSKITRIQSFLENAS